MTDSLERFLHDLEFELPDGLVERAKSATTVEEMVSPSQAIQDRGAELAQRSRRGSMRRLVKYPFESDIAANPALVLIAAVVTIAIVATLLLAAHFVRPSPIVPARPAPLGPSQVSQPIVVAPPFVPNCPVSNNSFGCAMQAPVFATKNVGWLTAGYPGETNLYRTEDGGGHWKALLSWMGGPSRDIRATGDGEEALVVVPQPTNRGGLLHTTDGGMHWISSGIPICSANDCFQWIYFLNAREGWVMQPGSAPDIEELYRTDDSGASWTLQSHFSPSREFPGQQMSGYLVFQSVTNGWFLPVSVTTETWLIYQTTDGGQTWHRRAIPVSSSDSTPLIPTALVERPGIIRFQTRNGIVVSTSSDAGVTWSPPLAIPIGGDCFARSCAADFVDSHDWIGVGNGELMATMDAGKHWRVLSDLGPFAGNTGTTTPGCCWLDFVDTAHGWSVGNAANGTADLFGTADGGVTWNRLSLPLVALAPFGGSM
jgi:photosystem II stability/assembly factor-like uncharacterized protein